MKHFFLLHNHTTKKHASWHTRAFTLVEFVVILAIFSIMAGVALFNFSGFESNVSLTNLAHDIGLTIRQAQVFGGSATQSLGVFDSKTRGVYFEYDQAAGTFQKTFIVFVDIGSDGKFGNSEKNTPAAILDEITVSSQDRISQIEVGSENNTTPIESDLHITFTRPDPEALILAGSARDPQPQEYARITIESPSGNTHFIEVFRSGQISVTR